MSAPSLSASLPLWSVEVARSPVVLDPSRRSVFDTASAPLDPSQVDRRVSAKTSEFQRRLAESDQVRHGHYATGDNTFAAATSPGGRTPTRGGRTIPPLGLGLPQSPSSAGQLALADSAGGGAGKSGKGGGRRRPRPSPSTAGGALGGGGNQQEQQEGGGRPSDGGGGGISSRDAWRKYAFGLEDEVERLSREKADIFERYRTEARSRVIVFQLRGEITELQAQLRGHETRADRSDWLMGAAARKAGRVEHDGVKYKELYKKEVVARLQNE